MRFLQGIDFFIGSAFQSNTDTLYKARLLVGIIFCVMVSVIIFALPFAFIPSMPAVGVAIYLVIAGLLLTWWGFLLHILKQGKAYTRSAHFCIASLYAVLFGSILITGGPFATEVHPLLIVPLITAFLLLGKAHGVRWAIAAAASYFMLVLMSLSGIAFMHIPPIEITGSLRIFSGFFAFSFSAVLVAIYESMNARMAMERDDEREKLEHIANVAVENSVVNESVDALANSGDALLEAAIVQKQAIEKLATTTEELGATADQNSHLARQAMAAITDTEQHLTISKADLLQLVSSMEQVKQSSSEIQSINNVINDISYQTNLLSLNAMIEASRSDDNGGFKVVALEVKKLAERSAEAAAEINELLSTNFSAVQQGVQLSDTMEQRFSEISDKIEPLSKSIEHVANASIEQNAAIHQITSGLIDVDQIIEENKNRAYRSSTAAKKLQENSTALMTLMLELSD